MFCSPISPSHMDWSPYFPGFVEPSTTGANGEVEVEQQDPGAGMQAAAPLEGPITNTGAIRKLTRDVEVADIGCGFGGLLVALAPKLPNTLMLGKVFSSECTEVDLTYGSRHGNQNAGCGIRPRADQSFAGSKGRRWSISECGMSTSKQHEIPSQFLQEGTTIKDLPLFPGPPLQSSKT